MVRWHAPLVLLGGTYQHELAVMNNKIFVANFFVSVIPAAIIANWFYYRNDRSIGASILLHSMLNAASYCSTPDRSRNVSQRFCIQE